MNAPIRVADARPSPSPARAVATVGQRARAGWILGMVLAWTSASPIHAQSIDVDFTPSFNGDVDVVAAYPGGRVVVGGDFSVVNGQSHSGLVRLLGDGSVDPAFNAQVAGNVLTLGVQLDGRIVIGGDFDQVNSVIRENLARLNADGSLDSTFVPAVPDDDIERLAVQADGKVLVAGRFDLIGGQARSYVARLLSTGAFDTGFNDPGLDGAVQAFAVQADEHILLGGDFQTVHGVTRKGIVRLAGNGNLDASFADPMVAGLIDAVTLLDQGRVLFTGAFGNVHGQSRPFIARLLSNGQLDASFVDANLRGNVNLRHLQPLIDGTTMLAGDWRWGSGTGAVRVGRILSNGQQDMDYNPVIFDSLVYGMALQTGGRIFAGGFFGAANGLPRSHCRDQSDRRSDRRTRTQWGCCAVASLGHCTVADSGAAIADLHGRHYLCRARDHDAGSRRLDRLRRSRIRELRARSRRSGRQRRRP